MNKQELEYFARKYSFLVIGISVLIFVLPLLLRLLYGAPITPGADSYLYLQQVSLLSSWHIIDPLHHIHSIPTPYVLLLALMDVFGVPWLLPPLLGVLLLVLLYYYITELTRSRMLVLLAIVLIALSPSMSLLATHQSPILLGMVLLITTLLLIQKYPLISGITLFITTLTAPTLGIIASIFLIIIYTWRQQHQQLTTSTIALIASTIWLVAWPGALTNLGELARPTLNPVIFYEIGSIAGISIFIFILAVYGVIVLGKGWRVGLFSAGALLLAIFFPSLIIIATIALSMLAARGVYTLMTTKWELHLLQLLLLIIICCIGLFIIITTIKARETEMPDVDFSKAMIYLRYQYHTGAVLTDPQYASMVEYFSNRTATINDMTNKALVNQLLYSRSPDIAYPALSNTNTSYILITNDMLSTTFNNSDEGLLFLLPNTEQFVKVSQTPESTLWFFIKLN